MRWWNRARAVLMLLAVATPSQGAEPERGAGPIAETPYRLHGKVPGAGTQNNTFRFALSADGKCYVTGRGETGVRTLAFFSIWDIEAGKKVSELKLRDTQAYPFAVSPDGRLLATTGFGRNTSVRYVSTGKEVRSFHGAGGAVLAIAFSADGKLLAEGGQDSVNVWDLATGKKVHELEEDGRFCALAFAPDGTAVVAAAINAERPVYAWNLVTGQPLASYRGVAAPKIPAIAPGKETLTAACLTVGFTTDGNRVYLAGTDAPACGLWEAETGRLLYRGTAPAGTADMVFAPDGRSVLSAGKDRLTAWDIWTGKERGRVATDPRSIQRLAFANHGWLLVGDGTDDLFVWGLAPTVIAKGPKPAAADLDACWNELRTDAPQQAERAANRFLAAPDAAVPYLAKQVRPAPPLDPQRVAQLIRDLDSKSFAARQRATDELQRLGPMVEDAIRKALAAKPPLEVRRRFEQIREQQLHPYPTADPELLRTVRSIEVLERIGTPEARQVLERLAGGAVNAWPTLEAQTALRRLKRKAG